MPRPAENRHDDPVFACMMLDRLITAFRAYLPALAVVSHAVLACVSLSANDSVIVRPDKKGTSQVQRAGTILEYTGKELRIEVLGGRVESVSTERVVEIRTTKNDAHKQAEQLLADDRLDSALGAFKQAKQQEQRPWMVRQISAQLVGCYLEQNSIEHAGDEFLSIVASDPDTFHIDVIPLPWRLQPTTPAVEAKARFWIQREKQPLAVLLGASWLYGTADRPNAMQTLQKLASGNDRTVSLLAEAQLWRTKLVTANESEVLRWQEIWERFPDSIRPTATFILADGFARVNRPETSAAFFMQLPILAPQQRGAAADGLLFAGKQLEKIGQGTPAVGLYRELTEHYSASPSAAEARARLASLTSNPKDNNP